jgi:hypothetical protein
MISYNVMMVDTFVKAIITNLPLWSDGDLISHAHHWKEKLHLHQHQVVMTLMLVYEIGNPNNMCIATTTNKQCNGCNFNPIP